MMPAGRIGMNESDWDQSTDLQALLTAVGNKLDARKGRLFACGCCRLVWPLLADPASRRAIEVSEDYAEGRVNARDLARAWRECWAADRPDSAGSAALDTASTSPSPAMVAHLAQRAGWWHALRAAGAGEPPWSPEQHDAGHTARREMEQQQCRLLREITSNPFRRLWIDRYWCEANDGAVRHLATLIARERNFAELPVLADALEEAGCRNEVLLNHCRRADGHVTGCWVLDAILAR
jgi:hypothetical protein